MAAEQKSQWLSTDQLTQQHTEHRQSRQDGRGGASAGQLGGHPRRESLPCNDITLSSTHQHRYAQAMLGGQLPTHRESIPLGRQHRQNDRHCVGRRRRQRPNGRARRPPGRRPRLCRPSQPRPPKKPAPDGHRCAIRRPEHPSRPAGSDSRRPNQPGVGVGDSAAPSSQSPLLTPNRWTAVSLRRSVAWRSRGPIR